MGTLTFLPLSQSELHGTMLHWPDNAFADHLPKLFTPLMEGHW